MLNTIRQAAGRPVSPVASPLPAGAAAAGEEDPVARRVGDQGRTGPEAVRKFIQKIKAKRQALVDDSIAEFKAGIASGEFRPADPAQIARLLSALIQGYFVELFWLDEKPDIEAEARILCDFILRGIAMPRPASV